MDETSTAATEADQGSAPDGSNPTPPGADSAPAANDAGEKTRIDELTRNWRETQRDRDYWRDLALRGQRTGERDERPEHQEPSEPELKTLADFNYDERAYTKYVHDIAVQTAKREADAVRKELRESRTQEEREYARAEFQDRAEAWAREQKVEDFDLMFADPRDGGPVVTETMAETIMDSENGHALLYHLAKNRALATRIARLPPLQQARELGRLEARLGKVAPKQVSDAPPPAPTIHGGSEAATSAAPDSPASDSLSAEDWLKRRNKQLAKARSGR